MKLSALPPAGLGLLFLSAALLLEPACTRSPEPARAFRVETRSQLVGGRRALGEVGDFKLSNGIIQAIVQDKGHSRGFGVFGGSLIDVDLVRGGKSSSALGAAGGDDFTEMFPAFFLGAIEPDQVEVLSDGREGGPAAVRVSGTGGNFMTLTRGINELVLGKAKPDYHVDYVLEPGKQYLKAVTTVTNPNATDVFFPVSVPFGFITLMGEGQKLFVPGKAGYDARFHLEEVYQQPSELEAIPGVVAPMIATEGPMVSYAVAASPRGAGYMANAHAKNPVYYPTAKPDSLLVPLASGSFLATFWGRSPPTLAAGKSYTFTGYVAVGTGDIASAQRVVYGIQDEGGRQPVPTGTLSGVVREADTGNGLADVTVVFQDEAGDYVGSARTQKGGVYTGPVPPGRYKVSALDPVRTPVRIADAVQVDEGGFARQDLLLLRPAALTVSVKDETGRLLPAKVSVEGVYDSFTGGPPREFLYNLRLGERVRPSDLVPDDSADPATRRYMERIFFAPTGTAARDVRPGKYQVWASRGIEYDLASAEVELAPGEAKELTLVLRHVLPTPGWLSADFHVHSANSVDSEMALTERVASYAAEGVDFLAATDHNYVSDFQPVIEGMDLADWLKSTVGLELSSLEIGHFNAYPLLLDQGAVTHGSFDWFWRPPGDLFAQLRAAGKYPGKTVVQVNHPRDSIQGYFAAFNLGTYTGTVLPPSSSFHIDQNPQPDGGPSPYAPERFSLDFDALEVFNGKHLEQLHSYRVPAVPDPGPAPTAPFCSAGATTDCIPDAGMVLETVVKVPDPAHPGTTYDQRQPVYPGVLDDWYTLLGKGHRFTATGNSDSHSAASEAGVPRTYLRIGDTADGSMRGVSEEAVVDALRAHRAVVTNGPFVTLWVNQQPIGSDVVAPDGVIDVRVRVEAAPWVDVRRVLLLRGGPDRLSDLEVLKRIDVAPSTEVERLDEEHRFTVPDNSFVVAEVEGDRSMWPVFMPYEVPPILLNDAVGRIGATFGLGNKWGRYRPNQVIQVKPFAVTNPVWIGRALKSPLIRSPRTMPWGPTREPPRRSVPDLRRLFGHLHADE